MPVPRWVNVPALHGIGTGSGRSLRGMGLAEAHYNRRGQALRLAHDIYSAPCEALYHAGTGAAVNCNRQRPDWCGLIIPVYQTFTEIGYN